MTKLDALNALAEMVKTGEFDNVTAFEAFDGKHQTLVGSAFTGSLDAAKALHEAVLPGYDAQVFLSGAAWVFTPTRNAPPKHEEREDIIGIPARALLLCILKALIWKEEQ